MKYINEYFKEKNKDITFIEIKDDSNVYIKDFKINPGISLPIMTEDLVKKIHTKNIDEIKIQSIIDGIIYLLGIDPDFIYNKEYKSILQNYDKNINEYILYKSIKSYGKGNYDKSGIYSRSLLSIDKENLKGLFNYSLVLEKLGLKFMEKSQSDKADEFISKARDLLNDILKIDEEFKLAYYKLGFHYKYFENYLKARLIWEKFLQMNNDEILSQEVREELNIIEDDSNLEMGLTYLNHKDYDKALNAFLKLLPKHKENWNVNYLLGQTYNGLNEFELSLIYMNNALDLKDDIVDIYNSLGIIYMNTGNIRKAMDIFNLGIAKLEEEYTLYFNRGLLYVQEGEYEKALKDIEYASNLNPEDERVKSYLEQLKSSVQDI